MSIISELSALYIDIVSKQNGGIELLALLKTL